MKNVIFGYVTQRGFARTDVPEESIASVSSECGSVAGYCKHCSKLIGSLYPDDRRETFFRNVGSYKSHTS
jgi:hypothetical protein